MTDPQGRKQSFNPFSFKESIGVSRTFVATEDRKLSSRLGFALIQHKRNFFSEDAPSTATEPANSTASPGSRG